MRRFASVTLLATFAALLALAVSGRAAAAQDDPPPELCTALVRASQHGAAGLFPWHEAVLGSSRGEAPGAVPETASAPPPAAAPAASAAPDPLARGRALLLARRPAEAWLALRAAPASGAEASYLRAWAAAEAGAPESAALLEPFLEPPARLACRAPALRAAALQRARAGDLGTARELLGRLGRALPEIPDYVLLWSLQALAAAPLGSAGPGSEAETLYRDLLALDPPAAVLRAADLARAGLIEGSPEPVRAVAVLGSLVTRSPRTERPPLLLRLAELEGRLGRAEAARGRLRVLVDRHPESDEAAALLAPKLVERGARPWLSARDSARVLAAHGRSADAVRALTPTADRALLTLRAEIRLRSDDYAGAARDYAQVLERGGNDELRLELAKALTRAGRAGAARRLYEQMLAAEGGSVRAARLVYLVADAFQEESVTRPEAADSAAAWFRGLVDRHPADALAPRGLLRLAHLRFSRGAWAEAETLYREHLRRYARSEDGREARYWLARTLREAGRTAEARELLGGLLGGDPTDYYRLLARRRLGGAPDAAVAALFSPRLSSEPWTPQPPSAAADTALPAGVAGAAPLRRARALLLVGEDEAAQREIDEALRLSGRSREELRRVARWALAHGFPESAFRVATVMLEGGDAALAPLAFPPAFAGNVAAEAGEHGVPPALLWAVMRQESRFDPQARSPAGALGLMQLMPATARREAAEGRAATFELADLTRPEANLHLGARHLRGLLDSMGGDVAATLAAYNAGAALASRWRELPEATTPEGYVERIPFRETRAYVKRILSNRAWYEDLHGGD